MDAGRNTQLTGDVGEPLTVDTGTQLRVNFEPCREVSCGCILVSFTAKVVALECLICYKL